MRPASMPPQVNARLRASARVLRGLPGISRRPRIREAERVNAECESFWVARILTEVGEFLVSFDARRVRLCVSALRKTVH